MLVCSELCAPEYAGLIVGWIHEIGAQRVGFLCTDNAANMQAARRQTVQTYGLTHIVEIR